MRYWWVSQNQTFQQEFEGGYLWSPKRNSDGSRNSFYEFMREVAPGDVVYSFFGKSIPAIGIASSHAYEAPKPEEFGETGAHWQLIGWRVDVAFRRLQTPIYPRDHMDRIGPLLPERYSPLQLNGNGMQRMYLTSLQKALGEEIARLIGREASTIIEMRSLRDEPMRAPAVGLDEWELHQMEAIVSNPSIPPTTRRAVVLARRGQGVFKQNVQKLESRCRVTGVDRLEFLRASHCKPWRDSNNQERLDGENGLLLAPHVDHLFDRGFISFEDKGRVLISPVADKESLFRMGLGSISGTNVGKFAAGQRVYLDFHRENVFLEKRTP